VKSTNRGIVDSTNRGIVNRRQSPDTRIMFRTASTLEALVYWMGEDEDTADFIVSVLCTIEWLAGDGLPHPLLGARHDSPTP